ncbi:hypothetical protein GDO86_018369 [Hymenochirus boettgeri]|uniref:C2H2-type domain-containing protein n=1 Tax=Hymenochirus boettgeri TaxID=247094 RepID=A0A8T2IAQ2_9PIPI|nr:hypothetical protein GDO86_018369 [Hymenochirus boettgeri]
MESSAGPLTDRENCFNDQESLFFKTFPMSEHQNSQGLESNGSPNTLGTAKEILSPRDQMVGENSHHYTECGEKFNTKILQSSSLQTEKHKNIFTCPECGKNLSTKKSLHAHKKIHTREKPYTCTRMWKKPCF